MKCSPFQWSKNLDNIIIVLTRSLMIDQRNKRPFVKNFHIHVLLMIIWKHHIAILMQAVFFWCCNEKGLFMIRSVWIRPHYNSRSKILKFSKWKYYRWWSIRAPLILLHPNHSYSSNPIPPKIASSSSTVCSHPNSLEVK